MKCLLFVSLVLQYCFVVAQEKYRVLAVGFYNVENLFNPEDDPNKQDDDFTPTGSFQYTEKVYKQKLHNIASVISQLGTEITPDGAAIIGISEVENDKALTDLLKQPALQNKGYRYVWFYGPDVRGISNALLYNPTYFTVLQAQSLHVPTDVGKNNSITRDVLYVKGILAGDTIHILVNHWPSRRGGEGLTKPLRAIAAKVNKKIADSLLGLNANTKVLIMGDLNDNPTDASVVKVLQAKADKEKNGFSRNF